MNGISEHNKLFEENIFYSNGDPLRAVLADTCIGRVPETAACAEKFKREGVSITLFVTPCWCYGSETMDMDPTTIKGVWGFNGTERPGAVYLAAVLAGHAQKGLPAFGIYGHEVQDLDMINDIPEDVKEKLLRFARAAVAVKTMQGKSYLQIGSQCMGIAGSIVDQDFMESYLGMRVESVDEDIKKMTDATVWCEAGFDNFRGGGFSSHFNTFAEMPCTMIRLNLVKGLGPVLQIAEGWTVNLPEDVNDKLMERTNPTWPCSWFAPRCDGKDGSPFKSAYEVMQSWGANHGAISYGHIGADLITLCSMLRIPVCMHNVHEDKIFRPAVWNAFSMDKEDTDYRACSAYGPLYK